MTLRKIEDKTEVDFLLLKLKKYRENGKAFTEIPLVSHPGWYLGINNLEEKSHNYIYLTDNQAILLLDIQTPEIDITQYLENKENIKKIKEKISEHKKAELEKIILNKQ